MYVSYKFPEKNIFKNSYEHYKNIMIFLWDSLIQMIENWMFEVKMWKVLYDQDFR